MEYCVVVTDNYCETHNRAGTLRVTGFASQQEATEYARRRTRASVEELRSSCDTAHEVRSGFLLFGESSSVVCDAEVVYDARADLDFFVTHPASEEERDWLAIEPSPPVAWRPPANLVPPSVKR